MNENIGHKAQPSTKRSEQDFLSDSTCCAREFQSPKTLSRTSILESFPGSVAYESIVGCLPMRCKTQPDARKGKKPTRS